MRTEQLTGTKSSIQFSNWTVEHGPTQWDERDVWTEIDDYLKINDVRAAAGLLRHYLEYISAELCHRLRAPVEFRGDAQYQLGELLPAAISRLRKLYGKAKDAENSWGHKDQVEYIAAREATFAILADASKAEQWQLNAAVHYNSWVDLGKGDFEPLVKTFRNLLTGFTCSDPNCSEYLRVSPDRQTSECLRCECGKTNINLLKGSPHAPPS